MRFNWCDYLNLANQLSGKAAISSQEAKSRSAISRAYYAVFCSSRNCLIGLGHTFPKRGRAHKDVRRTLESKSNLLLRQIGVNLGRLWTDRKNADYEDQFRGDLSKKTDADLRLAEEAINDLGRIKAT